VSTRCDPLQVDPETLAELHARANLVMLKLDQLTRTVDVTRIEAREILLKLAELVARASGEYP